MTAFNQHNRAKPCREGKSGAISGQGCVMELPNQRRLQVFLLDPAADVQLETALISRGVLTIPWEPLSVPSSRNGQFVEGTSSESPPGPGPVGEYLEIIDVDPASNAFYEPVDLDEPHLLANDGLDPSTGNPQFHQQMVYAIAMKTIANFEQALGRKIFWAERLKDSRGQCLSLENQYVQRLRIYPHAMRDQNAYYSPHKKALLFGYFNAPTQDPRHELPGGVVFTCLSHDIIAHETAHAILDGIHRRLLEPSNPDMLAFHEAFADLVAIFQHFTLPGLLRDQIQRTRGQLESNNLLARLAVQFARSTGRGTELRNALGIMNERGERQRPNPHLFSQTLEPHARGAILVAAVFDAFLNIYENRVADLRRLGTGGTGILPEGDIHLDLANRFAWEAKAAADRMVTMCIRAVDYLPPVDVTFGDYLRALITADADLNPDDPRRHRLALIQAFRDHGIYPLDIRSLGEDSLRWNSFQQLPGADQDLVLSILPPANLLRSMASAYVTTPEEFKRIFSKFNIDDFYNKIQYCDFTTLKELINELLSQFWLLPFSDAPASDPPIRSKATNERKQRFIMEKLFARIFEAWIKQKAALELANYSSEKQEEIIKKFSWILGIRLDAILKPTHHKKSIEVLSIRPMIRNRADGNSKVELLIIITQKFMLPLHNSLGEPIRDSHDEVLTYRFRGGSTIIIDPDLGQIRFAISKNLSSESRQRRQEQFLCQRVEMHPEHAVASFGLTEQARHQQRAHFEPLSAIHCPTEYHGSY